MLFKPNLIHFICNSKTLEFFPCDYKFSSILGMCIVLPNITFIYIYPWAFKLVVRTSRLISQDNPPNHTTFEEGKRI